MRHSCCETCGALPTGLNLTVTLALGNVPAVRRALAASRGRAVRIMEEAIVRGRSGERGTESGIAAVGRGDWGVEEGVGEEVDMVLSGGLRGLRGGFVVLLERV